MDNTQKDKQQYLFQEIIQKNYDPEQFQEHILQAKPGGDDLDNWNFNELQQVVKKFQKKYSKDAQSSEKPNEQQDRRKSMIDNYLDIEESSMKSKYEEGPFNEAQDSTSDYFGYPIKCAQINPSPLVDKKQINVQVTKFDKKEGGIFEQSYVCYYIHTPSLGKTVERRYSDFEWLKASLEMLHPGIPVPPIAKKGQYRRYDDKHLRKRMMILEMFLNKLLEIPELRADPVVEQFITVSDRPGFQKLKAMYKPNGKLIALKTVRNIKGNLVSAADQKTNSFLSGAKRHMEHVQPMVKTLYKDFKGAATSLEQCGSVLKGIGTTCQNLDRLERKFKKENDLNYCPNNFFTILSEGVSRLAQQLLNQALIFRTQYYSLIKYDSLYMINLIDNFQVLADIKEKFLSGKQSLMRKKQKLFAEGNMEKWELEKTVTKSNKKDCLLAMLPKQSKKLQKLQNIYGIHNYEMFSQIQRYFTTKNVQQGSRLQQICKNETRLCSEMMMVWVDAETNIMGLRQNKSVVKC